MARAPPDDGTAGKFGLVESKLTDQSVSTGRIKMSIHDFRSKFVSGGERNILFVALRRLSLLEDPRSLFAGTSEVGWPIWDEKDGQVPSPGGAPG